MVVFIFIKHSFFLILKLEWDVSIVAQCEGQEGGQLKHWIQSHNNFLTIIPDSVRYNSSLFSDLQNEVKIFNQKIFFVLQFSKN